MSLIFRVICTLSEQIPYGINRDIQTSYLCGAKIRNTLCVPSHLIRWIPHTDAVYQDSASKLS